MPITVDSLVRSRRKTISLIIRPDGSLEVRAPLWMPEKKIAEFVESHSGWVRKHQSRAKINKIPPPKTFQEGEEFLFLWRSYPLHYRANLRVPLEFDGTSFLTSQIQGSQVRDALIRWYKEQALSIISGFVKTFSSRYGFSPKIIRLSSARTRWGSCSSKMTLSFTWRLVMAPPKVIEYVVLHELVHTRVHNHSQAFWKSVGEIIPDFKQSRNWLNQNGKFLTLD